jgi:hypothetical protein
MAGLAAFGLLNASTPLPDVPLAAAEWRPLMERTMKERLSGHLIEAIGSGAFAVTPEQQREAVELHRRATWRVLMLERRMIEVYELLSLAGIDVRVLKGPALARTSYPRATVRTFIDLDVLVPSVCFDDAMAALVDAGYTRPLPQLRAGFDRRFGKTAMLLDPDGLQVDVHRTLVIGPYGLLIGLQDLFATCQPITVGGRLLKALGAEEQFLNVCYHAALGNVPPRLSALRDVAQTLVGSAHTLDLGCVGRLAEAWRGTAVLARAVRLTWEALALTAEHPLVTWARGFTPGRVDRQLLACYMSARRSNGAKYVATARVIPSLTAKLAYFRALMLPERAFLERRGVARGAWWRHGASGLLRQPHLPDGPGANRRSWGIRDRIPHR